MNDTVSNVLECASVYSEDAGQQNPPPLFLYCICSVTMKTRDDQPATLTHIPVSALPCCLSTLLRSSDDFDEDTVLGDMLNSIESVTLDVICIAPQPLKMPTSVSSTPIHRNPPMLNVMPPASDGAAIQQMTNHRRSRRRSLLMKETDGFIQSLSLHASQHLAMSALVKQLHWLVFDSMVMIIPTIDLDLAQLAAHVSDTLHMAESGEEDPTNLASFYPQVKKKRRALKFVFGVETSLEVFSENLDGWSLLTADTVVRRLGKGPFFYCAIPCKSPLAVEALDLSSSLNLRNETPLSRNPNIPHGSPPIHSVNSEGNLQLRMSDKKPNSVIGLSDESETIQPLRRRHQSAAPLVPPIPSRVVRSRHLSSRRQMGTTTPPGSAVGNNLFSPPTKGSDSLKNGDAVANAGRLFDSDEALTNSSASQSIFTGGGYESDSENTNNGIGDIVPVSSPIGVHSSQTSWIFCK